MLAHAIDNPAPSTIVLISGDRDFAYALSILRLRRYNIVLITLSNAHPSLKAQASLCFDWISDVIGTVNPTSVLHQPTSPRRGKTSIPPPTHDKFHLDIKNYNLNLSKFPFREPNDEKPVNSVDSINQVRDKAKYEDICLTPPKRDIIPDFPPELESSKRQPVASMTSTNARNGPESTARVINSPVASSSHANLNDSIEVPLIVTSHNSNSLQTSPSSGGNSPTLAPHGGIIASGFHILRGSTSLPNLVLEHKITSVTTEPVSFESAMQTPIPPDEPDLRGHSCSPSPQQQSTFSSKTHGLAAVNQMYDLDDNPKSSPAHLNVFQVPSTTNVATSLPTLSFTLPSSLVNYPTTTTTSTTTTIPTATAAAAAAPLSKKAKKAAAKAAKAARKPPPIADKFKILIECLKSHRSKGIIRPLRSQIALEIAHNGVTYQQAGVTKFREYAEIAEKEGVIVLGGLGGTAWIALLEPWV